MILGEVSLPVQRRSGSYDASGIYQPAIASEFSIMASVQPLEPRTVLTLPEAARVRARFVLYAKLTEKPLKTTDLVSQAPSDIVTYDGQGYEVFQFGDWTSHVAGLPHRSYVMLSRDEVS